MKHFRALALLLSVALIVVAVLLPNTALRQLRLDHHWFNWLMGWAEMVQRVNVVHLVIFGLLGATARLALPKVSLARLLPVVALFAAASEVVQFWVPGRTPRMVDMAQDVLGALIGVLLVSGLAAGWHALRGKMRP